MPRRQVHVSIFCFILLFRWRFLLCVQRVPPILIYVIIFGRPVLARCSRPFVEDGAAARPKLNCAFRTYGGGSRRDAKKKAEPIRKISVEDFMKN